MGMSFDSDSCIDEHCKKAVIDFYTEELKNNLRIALKPFLSNLKEPIQINITLGDI